MSERSSASPAWFRDVSDRFTGLELLFDLIFVFGVSQLTREFRATPTWATAGTALLIFVPVWWAWIGVTFATDRYPADDGITRALVIVAAGATAVMGLAIPSVSGHGGSWFALGYGAVRLLLAAFYWRARSVGPDGGRLARFYAAGFAAVGLLWVVSIAVPEPARFAVWGVAVVVDVVLPQLAGRSGRLLPVDRSHLAERCAAFVIIVIGEATVETITLGAEHPFTPARIAILVASWALTVALWWGFFDQGSWRRRYEALESERSGQVAATICSYLHFPVVVGIAGAAAGMQLAVEESGPEIGFPAAAAISIGCILYLLGLNAMTWVLRISRNESLARVRLVAAAGLLLLLLVGRDWHSVLFILVAVGLLTAHGVAGGIRTRADRRR
jgi:low temperature requirement protein LtrA